MPKIDTFLQYAVNIGASDLHFLPGSAPHVRLHGELRALKMNPLSAFESFAMISELLNAEQHVQFDKFPDLDFCYVAKGIGRFRANIFKQRKGVQAVFRIIPSSMRTLEELGLPQIVKEMTRHHQGMVLVTGPAGSGKSTTLAAMIDHINKNQKLHIITLEDPIEYVHKNQKSSVTQREIRRHTETFASALKAALREDPDVILIGEMRDLETISMAITAAETGHLVLGTLHTRNASKTVDRIIDVFPPSQQNQIRTMFAESMRGIISQQLIPKSDGSGRAMAYEILVENPGINNLIREGKAFQIPSLMQMGVKEGMLLMDQCLLKLMQTRQISVDQALARAENKRLFPLKPGPV